MNSLDNEDVASPTITAPLGQIRIHNFKSVGEATVDLSPLTVVVGRNSSGKSTLLQTVLALVQAIRSHSNSERFPLNGDLVRLGTFDELLTFQVADRSSPVSLGFTLSAPARRSGTPPHLSPRLADISWDSWLTQPAETSAGYAEISRTMYRVDITTAGPRPGVLELDAEVLRRESSASEDTLGRRLVSVTGHVRDYRNLSSERATSPVLDLLELQGSLPVSAFRRRPRFEVLARAWWDAYESVLKEQIDQGRAARNEAVHGSQSGGVVRVSKSAVDRAAADIRDVVELEEKRQLALGGTGRMIRRVRQQFTDQAMVRSALELDRKTGNKVAQSMATLGEFGFRELLKEKLSKEPWIDDVINEEVGGDTGADLDQASSVVEGFFRRVRYLGPLRELPKLLYNPGPDQVDLGTRGEYAAAVLHSQGDRIVQAPLPGGGEARLPLREALSLWLRRLNLVDDVKTEDLGRLGISLTVRPFDTDRDVDTTSVGVGVSQALPVVLLCLMAEPGTAVLIEQPELHLHPAMQLELADFLLACAGTGRQVLVESHSEHLVNRLRYHVAADTSGRAVDLIGLLFAEQEAGITAYRTSSINEYGGLDADWPKGFLNVAADEAARLLRQNLARKKAESGEDS
jgi:predicted ATPase